MAFGVLVVGRAIGHFEWRLVLYAVLSLTVIRILPVLVALVGWKTSLEGKLFVDWFGPRGLATIVFAIIVLDADLPGGGQMAVIAAVTIMLSILAHGVTANPWARGFGRRLRASPAA